MKQNIFLSSFRYLGVEVLWDIVYFPIWWYSKGLVRVANYCVGSFSNHVRNTGLLIWLQSMFKPMFGDYTWEGRAISFGMRIVVLIYKLALVVLVAIALFLLFIAWTVLPLAIIYYILFQLFNVPFPTLFIT